MLIKVILHRSTLFVFVNTVNPKCALLLPKMLPLCHVFTYSDKGKKPTKSTAANRGGFALLTVAIHDKQIW